MKKCILSRQSCKTTKLIKLSAKEQIPIIVRNDEEISRVKCEASKMNFVIPEPISVQQLMDESYLSEIDRIPAAIIDDAEYVLSYLLKGKYKIDDVAAISITTNDPGHELI